MHQVTIETPNYPKNYPNKAKCNWKIKVPAGEEVHIWCENFDVVRGDFLRVSGKKFSFGFSTAVIRIQVLGLTSKLYGSFADGFGEILPTANVKRTLKFQFRSNKKKSAGGFRCQVLTGLLLKKFQQSLQITMIDWSDKYLMHNVCRLLLSLPIMVLNQLL